jgi:quercetin 2,3-dioxygenase
MKTLRKAEERGREQIGWLDSRHTFSFGGYYDPQHMGFRALRVINDDRVAAGFGFPTHGHRDMEIISYVLDGALQHEDSTGGGSVIHHGDVQRMTAGRGIMHSEFNPSKSERLRFLQIWIIPEEKDLEPGYEEKSFEDTTRGAMRLIASKDARDGSLKIHQDVNIYAGCLDANQRAELPLAAGRHAWVHIARGEIKLDELTLKEGDGVAISDENLVRLEGITDGEVLVFDLP